MAATKGGSTAAHPAPDASTTTPSSSFKGHDLQRYCKIAEAAALQAGQFIRASLERRASMGLTVNNKAAKGVAEVDLVTEVDLQAEEIIIPSIRKAVHGHGHIFVGEESAFLTGVQDLTDAPHWFVDPLDGSINFVHGYPFVTVSIGLLIEKVPVVGVIYNPFLEELYTAYLGGGAFLNGKPLQVSSTQNIENAILATTLGASRDKPYLSTLLFRLRELLLHKLQGFRISGSTAQNLAHVASGKLDCYFDEDGFGGPWDVAAGIVLVKEAGGELRAINGGDFVFETGRGTLVCGNKAIVEEVVECVRKADKKMLKKVTMVQVKGWSGIGLMMLSALVGALLLGGKKGPRTSS